MTAIEFNKIALRRASFRKKGLLFILSSFFDVSSISHDDVEKVYIIPAIKVAQLSENELNIFEKLLRHFSLYDTVRNDKLYIKYNWI